MEQNIRYFGYLFIFIMLIMIPSVFSTAVHWMPHFDIRNSIKDSVKTRYDNGTTVFGCPAPASTYNECNKFAKFREFNGRCNNLDHPSWGSAGIPYLRFIPSQFREDFGLCKNNATEECPLPRARDIVAALNRMTIQGNMSSVSTMNMQFGQTIAHDINNTPTTPGLQCCVQCTPGVIENDQCLPIDVNGDEFFGQFNVTCLQNSRSAIADLSCTNGTREPVNSITAFIDGSLIYGISTEEALTLRNLSQGQLKIHPETEINGTCPETASCPFTLLPTSSVNGIERLLVGDSRAAQQPALTSMHHLFIRVHNYLALKLSETRPFFDDERLFQEARRFVIAIIQHITYNEYLPSILSKEDLIKYDLVPMKSGYSNGYNRKCNPSLHNAFSAAAYRFGHSLVTESLRLANDEFIPLSRSFINSSITYNFGTYPSDVLNGISLQQSQEVDQVLSNSITNTLFARGPSFLFGSDLYSRNILRGRDHMLPPYFKWREFCGLPELKSFDQIISGQIFRKGVAEVFQQLYDCPDSIDLYPALISERPKGNGIVGPTLSCLLGIQFEKLKCGDSFFYEANARHYIFTEEQLGSIRRTTMSSLLCAFTNTERAPQKALEIIGKKNKVRKCKKILKKTLITEFKDLWK